MEAAKTPQARSDEAVAVKLQVRTLPGKFQPANPKGPT